MSERTAIVVIGAGPCGLAVGAAARAAGMSCVLLDKGPVVSSIERYPIDMTFFSTADHLEIRGVPFISDSDNPTRSQALNYYRRIVEYFDLDVRQYETVTRVERLDGEFGVHTCRADRTEGGYRASSLVVATGYFDTPNLLEVEGEDLPKVTHYFREPHRYFDQDVLVVGGGNSAVEAALTTWRAGARVSMVHFLDDFDRGVKPWVLPDIRNRVSSGEIEVAWGSRVLAIEPGRVKIGPVDDGGERWIANDFVLAMTGFRPDPRFLQALGAQIDATTGVPVHDPATMETTVPGLFIAGVLAAGLDANRIFIQNGREHGDLIVSSLRTRLVDGPRGLE
jgi:thioredoxin reductase (NADPH)